MAQRVGLRRQVQVLEAAGLSGPVTFGVVKPALAVPAGFANDFTESQQEVMLAHELTHLAAWDAAWHLVADLVSAAFWWQPMVWWARHQLRAASEEAADEAAS